MVIITAPPKKFKGTLHVPGDKSISHRALILGALAEGITGIRDFLEAEDCLSTLNILKHLGVAVKRAGGRLQIWGRGKRLQPPPAALDAGNSGTTARLMMGVLAGHPFQSILTGDRSLCRRPMKRVIEPLRRMGARFESDGDTLPVTICGGKLRAIEYALPVASAQVKSAVLLAGLFAEGTTTVVEPVPTRNHTELMLQHFGVPVRIEGNRVSVAGGAVLKGRNLRIPGDLSAATFFLAAASMIPGSSVVLKEVGINPTRSGIIDALQEMGAQIKVINRKQLGGEPVADLHVTGVDRLRGIALGGALIPTLIDELPVLAVVAAVAEGKTEIRDAVELRVKESDRIAALARELARLGADIQERPDGMVINGGARLKGSVVDSHGDHRIAMALAVAGLVAEGETAVRGFEAVNISFPGFIPALRSLTG